MADFGAGYVQEQRKKAEKTKQQEKTLWPPGDEPPAHAMEVKAPSPRSEFLFHYCEDDKKWLNLTTKEYLKKHPNRKLLVGKSRSVIEVNSFLLASYTPVFDKLFHHDQFSEKDQKEIIIEDDPIIFNMLINWIYDDLNSFQFDQIFELRKLADKYQIDQLVKFCENNIIKMITRLTIEQLYQIYMMTNPFEPDTPESTFFDNVRSLCEEQMMNKKNLKKLTTLDISTDEFYQLFSKLINEMDQEHRPPRNASHLIFLEIILAWHEKKPLTKEEIRKFMDLVDFRKLLIEEVIILVRYQKLLTDTEILDRLFNYKL
jgi:hypothetical protein